MAKEFFAKLEALAQLLQVKKIKKKLPRSDGY